MTRILTALALISIAATQAEARCCCSPRLWQGSWYGGALPPVIYPNGRAAIVPMNYRRAHGWRIWR